MWPCARTHTHTPHHAHAPHTPHHTVSTKAAVRSATDGEAALGQDELGEHPDLALEVPTVDHAVGQVPRRRLAAGPNY